MALELQIKVRSGQASSKVKKFGRDAKKGFAEGAKGAARMRQQTTGLTRKIGALRNKLLLFTFATASAFKLIKLAGTQEKALARLDANLQNVLVSFQGLAKGTERFNAALSRNKAILTGQARALQKITTFGDEQTISAQAMLSTFALTGSEVAKLTPALLDMAAATETTTGRTVDLEQIAIAVGKSLTIGVGALTRYGVVISDSARESFKFATTSEKVNIILEELNKNFAGVAEKIGKTKAGRLSRIGNALGDIGEGLGDAILPDFLLKEFEFEVGQIERLQKIKPFSLERIAQTLKAFTGFRVSDTKSQAAEVAEFQRITQLHEDERAKKKRNADEAEAKRFEELVRRQVFFNKIGGREIQKIEARRGKIFELGQKMVAADQVSNSTLKDSAGNWKVIKSTAAELIPLQSEIEIANENREAKERAIKQSEERQNEALNEQLSLVGNIGASFADMLIFGQGIEESVKNIVKQLASKAVFSGIFSLLGGGPFSKLFFGLPGFANGTNFAPGGAAIVGERGPEVVNLPRGSQVVPSNQISNVTNSSNVSVVLPNVTRFDEFAVRTELMPMIKRIQSEGGVSFA